MYPSGDRYFLIPLMSERPSSSISIQIQGQPPSPGIPVFDWKLCAELHNVILDIGWSVVRTETRNQPSTIFWWEDHFGSAVPSPSEDKEGKDKPKAPSQTRETEGGKVAEVSPKLRSAQTEALKDEGSKENFIQTLSASWKMPRMIIQELRLQATFSSTSRDWYSQRISSMCWMITMIRGFI